MRTKVNRVIEKISKAEKMLIGGLFILLTAIITLNIIMRALRLHDFSWLNEFAQYTFICAIVIGASNGVTDDSLMKVRVFEQVMPKPVCKIVNIITNLAVSVIAVIMGIQAIRLCKVMLRVQAKTPVMNWPVALFYGVMAAAFIGMCIRSLLRTFFPPEENNEKAEQKNNEGK